MDRFRRKLQIAASGALLGSVSVAVTVAVGLTMVTNNVAEASVGTGSTTRIAHGGCKGPKLFCMLPKSIREAHEITVATDPEFPPYEYYLNGKLTGFEPALLRAIVKKLDVKLDLMTAGFDELIPGVDSARFEAAMSGISDLPSREEQVTFVDYGDYATAFVTTSANPAKISSNPLSVCGKSVSGVKGTITVPDAAELSKNCLAHHEKAVSFTQFATSASSELAAESGRVDAQIEDYIEAVYEAQETKGALKVFAVPFLPKGPMGIITKIGATRLDDALLAAVKAIQADGTYKAVIDKWKIPSAALYSPGINLNRSGKYGN